MSLKTALEMGFPSHHRYFFSTDLLTCCDMCTCNPGTRLRITFWEPILLRILAIAIVWLPVAHSVRSRLCSRPYLSRAQ